MRRLLVILLLVSVNQVLCITSINIDGLGLEPIYGIESEPFYGVELAPAEQKSIFDYVMVGFEHKADYEKMIQNLPTIESIATLEKPEHQDHENNAVALKLVEHVHEHHLDAKVKLLVDAIKRLHINRITSLRFMDSYSDTIKDIIG